MALSEVEVTTHLTVVKLFAVAAMLSLVVSACGEDLPTTPRVAPSPSPEVPSYHVSGHVHGLGQMPIAGARVEVYGAGGVRSSQTNSSGFFEFDTVPGSALATIYVSAEGYWTVQRSVSVVADSSFAFELARNPLASGTYTLTIDASAECRHQLPEAARTRRYTAVVRNAYDPWDVGPYVDVRLSGANFRVDGLGRHDGFYGVPFEEGVSFVLVGDHNTIELTSPFVAVVEQLTPSTVLVIAGYANLSGTLDGVLHIVPTGAGQDPDYRNPIAACRSNAHQFVLSR